jgi:hypothetical protein
MGGAGSYEVTYDAMYKTYGGFDLAQAEIELNGQSFAKNKGGMFIMVGAIDYGQRALMSYYLLCRLHRPVVCHLYRDIDDIVLAVSNVAWAPARLRAVIRHCEADGRILGEWESQGVAEYRAIARLARLEGYYASIGDRRREMLRAELWDGDKKVAEDNLFFCAWSEFENPEAKLSLRADKAPGGWTVEVATDALVKMLSIESDANLLLDDNYFSMLPGESRKIGVRALEALGRPAELAVSSLDGGGAYRLTLPQ